MWILGLNGFNATKSCDPMSGEIKVTSVKRTSSAHVVTYQQS